MVFPSDRRPYILGLDQGVQSIGWTVTDLDAQGNPCGIRRAGVRCFDSGIGDEKKIAEGKDESPAVARRQARQTRRQLRRRVQRQRQVLHLLQHAGLMPGTSVDAESRHKLMMELDACLAHQYPGTETFADAHLLVYRLRALALDGPLSPPALGRVFYHLAQRRGFLSNRKAAKKDDDEGTVKQGIAELQAEMDRTGARTLGEYFSRLDPEQARIRRRWTARAMFQAEFEKIWDAQRAHHSVLTDDLKASLHRALFFQRPLKSQKGLIAKCELEPNQRRAPMASLDAQRFRYLQKVNDLEIIAPDGTPSPLTSDQRHALVEALENQAELTFARVRKLLGLKSTRGDIVGYEFNLERGGETRLIGNRTMAKLSELLGDRWTALGAAEQDRLVTEILSFQREDALARRLERAWHFDTSTATRVATVRLEPGYASFSIRAIRKLLPSMRQGERLNAVKKAVYADQQRESAVVDLLPPVAKAVRTLRNPLVMRALSELRKVVNALVRQYGKPEKIRIELARDMKRSRRSREELTREMRGNQRQRAAAAARIIAETPIVQPSRTDILKVLLADECNWTCPYTGKTIGIGDLVGANPQFDIEHILPFSMSLDNSFANKTLCYHEENRIRKGNRTPWNAYSGDAERWTEILSRVRRFRGNAAREKLRRFQLEEIPDDFVNRHLNDTRYISRLAGDYLGMLYGGQIDDSGRRIQVSTGRMTAYLRDDWGLGRILGDGGDKDRSDHRHHAVDAAVISLVDPAAVQTLQRAAERADRLGHRLFAQIEPPWPTLVDDVARAVEAINVSFRVDRRVSGALHAQTFYGGPAGQAADQQEAQYRHVRKSLSRLSEGDVEYIVDPHVRAKVQEALSRLGGKPDKAFAAEANLPYFRAKDGRVIPIRKARIRKNVTTIAVGKRETRFVEPGSNHHMEIVALTGRKGESWVGEVVSLFEASRRLRAGEPVIKRDHRPGRTFRFSLAGGEYVEMEHEPGRRLLYRVTVITKGQVEFRLHSDARATSVMKKMPGARVRRSPGALLTAKARKVVVDPLGNILPAND